jgi:hypothetical protein
MRLFHPIGRIDPGSRGKLPRLRQIDSPRPSLSPKGHRPGMLDRMTPPDPTLAKILARFDGLDVAKTRGGYTLHDRRTGSPVARLKPIPDTDRFELLYWSLVTEAWRTFGDFGRLKLTLDRAHEIFQAEAIFRIQNRR